MNKYLGLFLALLLGFSMACRLVTAPLESVGVLRGSGEIVRETRQVSGFDEIDVCCGMQLTLTQGDTESLEIEADDNLLPEILSSVTADKLAIRFRDEIGSARYLPSQPVRLRISARDIQSLDISGGGSLRATNIETNSLSIGLSGGSRAALGRVAANSLDVGISGGGEFSAQVLSLSSLDLGLSGGSRVTIDSMTADTLSLGASGGGKLTVNGSLREEDISWSGGGSYLAGDLESETASISMSGGGEAWLWVTNSLIVDLSGGAQVAYYGRPLIEQSLTGGSTLDSLGER